MFPVCLKEQECAEAFSDEVEAEGWVGRNSVLLKTPQGPLLFPAYNEVTCRCSAI